MKRIVVLFLVAQLLLLGVLFLTLTSDLTLDLMALDGEDTTIEIIGSKRSNGDLILSRPSPVNVDAGKKVIWKIRDGDLAYDVRWFDVEPKEGHPNVFKCDPPAGNRRHAAVGHLKGQLSTVVYEYSIIWLARDGVERTYDPKIAIRPGNELFELLIYVLYAALAGIISYMTFRKQKSSETRPT